MTNVTMHVLTVSAAIDAPAARLYAILADYREGHPSILPRPPFVSLTVEEGGVGAGTRIHVEMKVLGRTESYRAVVTEPEPGRTLVETNDTGYVTTFVVDAGEDGAGTMVTIGTDVADGGGVLRAIERRLVARLLRPVYRRELELLAERASAEPYPRETPGHR